MIQLRRKNRNQGAEKTISHLLSEFGVFRDVLLDLFFAFGQRFRAFLTERKVEKNRLMRTDGTLYQLVKQYSQVFRGICIEWGDLE